MIKSKNGAIQKTYHLENELNETQCIKLFNYLKENVEWEEGVRSNKGFTRLARALSVEEFGEILCEISPSVYEVIFNNINKYSLRKECIGVYLNYYKDGTQWCPNHTHKGTTQMIISLGATRTLKVGSKEYLSKNGDIIIFGASSHGIVKEACEDGRISIALFLV